MYHKSKSKDLLFKRSNDVYIKDDQLNIRFTLGIADNDIEISNQISRYDLSKYNDYSLDILVEFVADVFSKSYNYLNINDIIIGSPEIEVKGFSDGVPFKRRLNYYNDEFGRLDSTLVYDFYGDSYYFCDLVKTKETSNLALAFLRAQAILYRLQNKQYFPTKYTIYAYTSKYRGASFRKVEIKLSMELNKSK